MKNLLSAALAAVALAFLSMEALAEPAPGTAPGDATATATVPGASIALLRRPGNFLKSLGIFATGGDAPSREQRRDITRRHAHSVAHTSHRIATAQAVHRAARSLHP